MEAIASDQITISDLTDGYTIMLSMDAIMRVRRRRI